MLCSAHVMMQLTPPMIEGTGLALLLLCFVCLSTLAQYLHNNIPPVLFVGGLTSQSWKMQSEWMLSLFWPSMLKGLFQKEPTSLYTRLSQAAEAVADAPSHCPKPSWQATKCHRGLLSAAKLCTTTSLRVDPSLPHPILSQKIASVLHNHSRIGWWWYCDGLITDRVVLYCCQNDISDIKTSNNPVKKITACPLAGVSRWLILWFKNKNNTQNHCWYSGVWTNRDTDYIKWQNMSIRQWVAFHAFSLHQLMSSSMLNSLSGKTNLRAKRELCASVMYRIFKCF